VASEKSVRHGILALLIVTEITSAAPKKVAAKPAVWQQWRGPERTGVSPGTAFPEKLDGLKQLWRVELDKGYPGPIVAEDRVFTAETANTDTELVRALDRATGKELWRAEWKGKISVPFYAKRSGDWIRATPVYDGKTLFVAGMEEVLVALDGKTGKEVWRVDFPKRYSTPKPEFGFASSPLLDGEFLFVQASNSLVKIRKTTGETVWRVLEHGANVMESGAFSSPYLGMIAGKKQLLVQNRVHLHGVDPETGQELWKQEVPNFRGMNILTPVVYKDTVFTSTHQNNSYLYRVQKGEAGFGSTEVWKNKAKGYMSTPVLKGQYVYLHLGNQRMTCIDLETGESKWTSEPYGQYWSMVLRDDKILALDERGTLHLMRANPEKFELLDSKELTKSPAWGHLAVAGDEVFVRELNEITAYRIER
jgi:outer membrane protein assembly factor BamB